MSEAGPVDEITSEAELIDLIGEPTRRARDKTRPALHDLDRSGWLPRPSA